MQTALNSTVEIIEAQRSRTARAAAEARNALSVDANVVELTERDNLTILLRSAVASGIPVADLAEAMGVSVEEIQRQIDSRLHVLTGDPALC